MKLILQSGGGSMDKQKTGELIKNARMLDSISGGDSETVSFVSDKNTDVKAVRFI